MNGYGAQAYKAVSVDTGIGSGDPHQLVLMLYDGAIEALRMAFGHMKAGRVAEKGQCIGKAIRIIDEGLRISLDKSAGGELALRLSNLYEYMTMRLLQANLRNDASGLVEVAKLLGELREAWSQIKVAAPESGPGAGRPASPTAPASPAQAADAAPTGEPQRGRAPRFLDATYPAPLGRLATSA